MANATAGLPYRHEGSTPIDELKARTVNDAAAKKRAKSMYQGALQTMKDRGIIEPRSTRTQFQTSLRAIMRQMAAENDRVAPTQLDAGHLKAGTPVATRFTRSLTAHKQSGGSSNQRHGKTVGNTVVFQKVVDDDDDDTREGSQGSNLPFSWEGGSGHAGGGVDQDFCLEDFMVDCASMQDGIKNIAIFQLGSTDDPSLNVHHESVSIRAAISAGEQTAAASGKISQMNPVYSMPRKTLAKIKQTLSAAPATPPCEEEQQQQMGYLEWQTRQQFGYEWNTVAFVVMPMIHMRHPDRKTDYTSRMLCWDTQDSPEIIPIRLEHEGVCIDVKGHDGAHRAPIVIPYDIILSTHLMTNRRENAFPYVDLLLSARPTNKECTEWNWEVAPEEGTVLRLFTAYPNLATAFMNAFFKACKRLVGEASNQRLTHVYGMPTKAYAARLAVLRRTESHPLGNVPAFPFKYKKPSLTHRLKGMRDRLAKT